MKLTEVAEQQNQNTTVLEAVANMWHYTKQPVLDTIEIGRPLLRGMRQSNETTIIKTPPTNRSPKDTPQYFHELFDAAFLDLYGFRARSESVFATFKRRDAANYIEDTKTQPIPHAVFPFEPYQILYSGTVNDLYSEAIEEAGLHVYAADILDVDMEEVDFDLSDIDEEDLYPIVQQYIHSNKYKLVSSIADLPDTGAGGGSVVNAEFMIDCNKYLAVSQPVAKKAFQVIQNSSEQQLNKYVQAFVE